MAREVNFDGWRIGPGPAGNEGVAMDPELLDGLYHSPSDGGLPEADVDRVVMYLKRFRAAARVTVFVAAMGVGAIATFVYLLATRDAGGGFGG